MKTKYTNAEKARIVLEILKEEKTLAQIAAEYDVYPAQLVQWKKTVIEGIPGTFDKKNKEVSQIKQEYEEKVDRLYKKIGQLNDDNDFLKKKSEQLKLMRREKNHDHRK